MSGRPRVLIVGAGGQVGQELERSFAGYGDIVAIDRESADLAAPGQIRELVERVQPQVILNAAAYTAVDRAESEREIALAINAEAPRVLAEEARKQDALFVHYSTDYVFDGMKEEPWTEDDRPNPLNAYGASKLAGEEAIREVGGRYLIFRTSWVYGPHGNNFLLTMLRLGRERERINVVADQHGAPTTSIELADATHAVVDGVLTGRLGGPEAWAGLYHMTCPGATTWFGFAEAIFARAGELLDGKRPEIRPIPSSEYPTPAKRPRNSVLSNAKLLARFGVALAPWETALDAVVGRLVDASAATKRAELPRS
jgi:dTDP-4-dehydrorhamnose reductase